MSKCETGSRGTTYIKKKNRSLIIKKNKAKRRTVYCEERGNKMATQAIPPPIPQWQLWDQNPQIFRKTHGFVEKQANLRQTRRSHVWRIFPKSADFLIILKLLIFKETFEIKTLL
jgi:hypothetical protein